LHIRHHEPVFDSHITNLTRHQLLIIADPPISVSNPISSNPTRLGVDIQQFSISYAHSRTLPDPQSTPLNLTKQPIINTYNCQNHANPDYTPQSTFKQPKTTPEHDPSPGLESQFHKTFLGFFHIVTTGPYPLQSLNIKFDILTQKTTNPKKY
jgi:hypothetical protein